MPEKMTEQCSWAGCSRRSEADLIQRALCINHFLQFSHTRLKSIQQEVAHNSGPRNLAPSEVQSFLSQVISQTALLATGIRLLSPAVRAELIELSSAAAEISRQLHREPRLPRRIRCLLRTGMVSSEISEPCVTVNISVHGACLEIRRPLRVRQEITLERMETHDCTRARVAWIKRTAPEKFVVGMELLENEDFWGLKRDEQSNSSNRRKS